MKIAQLAPLWERVPPKTYGGTELVVYQLTKELIKKNHQVTLFSTQDSEPIAKIKASIKKPMRETNVEFPSFYEFHSISELLKIADEFDIIHNHMGYQFLPFAKLTKTPVVTTLHGAFTNREETSFYEQHQNLNYISISMYQRTLSPKLNYIHNAYNGIDIEKYEFNEAPDLKNPYLLFLGRLSKEKGVHNAITIAKETGLKLILAGKIGALDIEYYKNKVEKHIDNKQIFYVGEVGHKDKISLFKNALATLHPLEWPEPFGLVLTESMACGTPVLALRDGSIPEIILHGKTGFIENNVYDLVERVGEIYKIDRQACKKHVQNNFTSQHMIEDYLNAYQKVLDKSLV